MNPRETSRDFPYFGVSPEPDGHAHAYAADRPASVCGITLRDMQSKAETELPTCPACAEWARTVASR